MKPTRDVFVQYRVIKGTKFIMKNYHVFELDEIGEIVWDALDGETTVQQIAENISNIYNEPLETVELDIKQFIKELLEKELIEV
ncbi:MULTISPECIES: PqqD family protein [unclassified Paenibacillus]|uniref:PqqD family protein n=1 Tax=unclassified Paenibacillus TaxID=185978 RepID=UPI0030F6998B